MDNILQQNPIKIKRTEINSVTVLKGLTLRKALMLYKSIEPQIPYKIEIPKSMKPEEIIPNVIFFTDASAERLDSLMKDDKK